MKVPEDRYIQVNNLNTRYWMAGEGAPVVLLHDVMNSVEDWLLNIYTLTASILCDFILLCYPRYPTPR